MGSKITKPNLMSWVDKKPKPGQPGHVHSLGSGWTVCGQTAYTGEKE